MLGRVPVEFVGHADQRNVRERLGEIAQLAAGEGVVLLGQEAQVVAQEQKAFEEPAGVVLAAGQEQGVREPEGAGEERAFTAGEAVGGLGPAGARGSPAPVE